MRDLTSFELEYVSSCAPFAREVMAPSVKHWDEKNAFPLEIHQAAAQRGIPYAGFPRDLGGKGLSHLALVTAGLEMASVCAPMTFTLAFDHGSLRPVMIAGSPEQRKRWVKDLIAEGGHGAWCMTEPESSGSNLLAIHTKATRTNGGWRIDGHKCMVGMGTVAQVFFVLADAWDGDRRLGPTVFAVPRDAGVVVSENPPKIGFRCLPTPEVRFPGVAVGNDAVIGGVGSGLPVLLDSLDYMRLGGGVVILGLTRGALHDVAPWLDEREIYGGQRLGDTSHVQIVVGRLLARLAAAEALLFQAAADLDDGKPVSHLLSALKLVASDLAIDATSEIAQLWGWRGIHEDYPATKRLRDARQTSIYEGTSEIQAMNLFRRWASAARSGSGE